MFRTSNLFCGLEWVDFSIILKGLLNGVVYQIANNFTICWTAYSGYRQEATSKIGITSLSEGDPYLTDASPSQTARGFPQNESSDMYWYLPVRIWIQWRKDDVTMITSYDVIITSLIIWRHSYVIGSKSSNPHGEISAHITTQKLCLQTQILWSVAKGCTLLFKSNGIFFCNVKKWQLNSMYRFAILRVVLRGVSVCVGKIS